MIWYILIALFIALFLLIFFGPISLNINTDEGQYRLSLPFVFSANVWLRKETLLIKGWIFFIPYKINPFSINKKKKAKSGEKISDNRKHSKRGRNLGMIRGLLGSFRIRKLYLDIDTDDFILNAWLVPAFSGLNRENIQLQTNFSGNISLMADIRTRIGLICWNLFRSKYKSFF